jgi:hypothetical protein
VTLRVLRSAAGGLIFATVLLAAALALRPVGAAVAFDGYVLLLGGVLLLALVGVTTATESAARSPYEQALEAPDDAPERPPELARVEREVSLGIASSFYEHYRLRPLLREIAEQRLESRFAAGVDTAGGAAREALPEHAWELLDAERQPPRNRHAPGMPVDRLRTIVDALERLGEERR